MLTPGKQFSKPTKSEGNRLQVHLKVNLGVISCSVWPSVCETWGTEDVMASDISNGNSRDCWGPRQKFMGGPSTIVHSCYVMNNKLNGS